MQILSDIPIMFAQASGGTVINTLLLACAFLVIVGLLWYAVTYFEVKPPLSKLFQGLLFFGALIIVIDALLKMVGRSSGIRW
jgi:hypothetical protein